MMASEFLTIHDRPPLSGARMILGLSGWMDGGEASTGTIEYLAEALGAQRLASIDPGPFTIYNFPGSMDLTALFRPHARIEDGLITTYGEPENIFLSSPDYKVILFEGKEPNLRWPDFADCILRVATEFNVEQLVFVGSVAGLVPHTRPPRIYCSVSNDEARQVFHEEHGLALSNYEGPASFITSLMVRCARMGLPMASLVAEIPAYVQCRNVKAITAITKELAAILALPINFSTLSELTAEFEKRIDETVGQRPELAEEIRKIEKEYDEVASTPRDDELKDWFERQGIDLE